MASLPEMDTGLNKFLVLLSRITLMTCYFRFLFYLFVFISDLNSNLEQGVMNLHWLHLVVSILAVKST